MASLMRGLRASLTIHIAVAIAIGGVLQVSPARSQAAMEAPRRVLLFHSFGQNFSPWNAIAAGFRHALIKQSPYRIEFHDASLAMGRFQPPEDQRPFVDYLRALFAGRDLDLVVAMGAPAARFFLLDTRSELFPAIPLLIAGASEGALRDSPSGINDTIVGADFDQALPLDAILQVLPDTATIAVVHGSSRVEKFWVQNYRAAVQRLTGRVTFEWLNALTLEDLLERVARLPPHSAIYFTTFHVDEDGVPQDSDRVFDQLHKIAKAPIFSFNDTMFGHGIVGGPMLSAQELANRTAAVAVRLLNGETAGSIKTPAVGLSSPIYDWGELQRWGISESNLPPGSTVEFRQPSAWERFRREILAMTAALALLTILLVWSLDEHRRRGIAEAESRKRANELARINRFATAGELTASIAHEIRQPLAAIAAFGSAGLNWIKGDKPNLNEARMAMEKVVEESHRAGDFIKSVRAMFSNEEEVQTQIDLNELVEHVLGIMAGSIKLSGVALDLKLSKSAPLVIMGNPTQLQQVILNLVVNAMEAMRGSASGIGLLRIETEVRSPVAAIIRVSDSGPTVDRKVADNMFEPFFTTKPGGMGMGLSICRTIVEAHRGSLTATPSKPHGMEFLIALPLHLGASRIESGTPRRRSTVPRSAATQSHLSSVAHQIHDRT
ncbi:MAG: ATPase [Alphaproteobacteria bacterium]|nr:MAG: ATPase [Alphaproteobacteria bacterium]